MKWRTYPEYKNSRAEWLGKIPHHWNTKRLKFVADIQTGSTPPKSDPENYSDDGLTWVKPDGLGSLSPIMNSKERLSDRGVEYARISPAKSVLVCCIGSVGKVGVAGCRLATNQQINSLIFRRDLYPDYALYLIVASEKEHQRLANGNVVQIINSENEGNISLSVPPLAEQRAIAAFLDRETARIDALIEKKERQIELLQEKRAALISRAVTKGLDPSAKMKDSGIEWLGEIPEHWEIKRIKNMGHIKYGLGEPPRSLDTGLPIIRATDISGGKINMATVQRIDPDDVPWSRDPSLQTNDILVVRSGAYTGDSAIVQPEVAGAIAGYDMVLRVTKASPYFVAYALLSKYLLQGQIYLEKMRAAQPHLNAEELGNCIILIPPKPEQEEVVSYLNKETANLDKTLAKIDKSTSILLEYRTALISAAVTGKIDVCAEVF